MNSLEKEIRQLTRLWLQKGGKTNRRQQQRRMVAFANHAACMGANCMDEIGKRHAIDYWKAHDDLSKATLYNHWRALCILWKLAGMRGVPLKPHALTKAGVKTRSEESPQNSEFKAR